MLQYEESDLFKEKKLLEGTFKDSLKEMRKVSSFLKTFIKMHQEMRKIYENKDNLAFENNSKENKKNSSNSFLFTNINNVYDSFHTFIKETNNSMSSMEKDLVKPLDDFIESQLNFYKKDLNLMKKIEYNFQNNKTILNNSKNNYYKSSYISNKIDAHEIDNSIIKGNNDLNLKRDILTRKKMIARNDEYIYKYEIDKYNKNIAGLNKEYDTLIDNILSIEKTKIRFIQTLFDRYKKYLLNYVQSINNFINEIDKYNTKEIGEKEKLVQSNIFREFKDDNIKQNNNLNLRLPEQNYIPYQKYYESIKDKNKNNLELMKRTIINNSLEMNDNKYNNLVKETVNDLLGENDIAQDKIATIFEMLNLDVYEVGKQILNYLYEKRGISSIVFLNLQNLKHLSNILGYITLEENSIFKEHFELNFKIIFIAERIYYRKKSNNDKVYLSALLSRNKYYRTKLFWRDILEYKLTHKLNDHIKRFKYLKIQNNSKSGIFSRIGNAMKFKDSKLNFLEKSRILPLLKDYDSLEYDQLELINKVSIEEMQGIIKDNIPSFANFNFPSEQSLDLIAQLTQEYRINNEHIHYYVTYFNVSTYTIRKLLLNEKGNTINIYNQYKTLTGINKTLKIFKNIVPFLTYKDYNNLLLCSKLFHKKLSKVIYKHVLKQKNLDMKIRLSIWQNLLGIAALKKKYDYKKVLLNANEEKVKEDIELDIKRTTVGDVKNPQETREQITNILYAVSQLNGTIKYCQGMNFVAQILYEVYGEEEAFYIFLAFFVNTDYHLIFGKELKKLKILFYVFKRVISLLEPEIANYFNSNGVDVNFFAPPWFITLFTSSHQNFKGENDNRQILIRILDNFIVSGLKTIMKVGCAALHYYENELMSKRYEEMLQFLINDMIKSDFFSKKNKDYIENFFTNKISKKLVKNLEEEFQQEQKLKQVLENNNDLKK